jgi:glycosyltransferase involved in cell wall biosynthesis
MANPESGRSEGLKVVQICHDYEGPFQSVCQQYSSALSDCHVTTLFLRGKPDPGVEERTGGDEVVFLDQGEGALSGIKWTTIYQVYKLFKQSSFDLAIAHRYKSIYLAGLMSYFFPLKLVLGVAHEHKVFKRITRSLFVTFWRKRIVILGVSDSVTKDVETSCAGLKAQGRLYTLNNCIDLSKKTELLSSAEARKALGVASNALLLGTVGRLVAKKNHALLIQGFARADLPARSTLLLIGSGPEEDKLKALAADLKIEDRVVFKGHIPEAFRYLRALDIFVFSSCDAEAFGIVLLEAMLAEIPIISSNAKGPAEVMKDTGWLFDLSRVEDLAKTMSCVNSLSEADRKARTAAAIVRLESEYSTTRFRENLWGIKQMVQLKRHSAVP